MSASMTKSFGMLLWQHALQIQCFLLVVWKVVTTPQVERKSDWELAYEQPSLIASVVFD